MLANEILAHIERCFFKDTFVGIFASDNLPKRLKNYGFMIVNTDVKTGPGKHWYVIVRYGNVLECFDSLGVKPERKEFLYSHFRFRGLKYITYNTTPVQPITSTHCGEFVLYYLFERFHNLDYDFDDLLNEIFTEEQNKNDEVVLSYIKSQNGTGD